MGGVAALEALAKAVALHCLSDDDCWLTLVVHGRLVCRVDLLVVMAASLEAPNLVIAKVGDHGRGPWVPCKEVLPDKGSGFSLEGLVVTIWCVVHQVD